MAGISFAGGLSVVAAGRPSLAGRLAFVFSFGGHANFQRVRPLPLLGRPSRRRRASTIRRRVPPPHDYGVAIVALDLAEQLVPGDQVEPLKTGILSVPPRVAPGAVRPEEGRAGVRGGARDGGDDRRAGPDVPAPGQRAGRRPTLGPKLLPHVANLGDDPALSPDRSPAPDAPVFLLHGAEDNVVPALETLRLARHLEARTTVRVLLTPLISHAEVDRPASTARGRRAWSGSGRGCSRRDRLRVSRDDARDDRSDCRERRLTSTVRGRAACCSARRLSRGASRARYGLRGVAALGSGRSVSGPMRTRRRRTTGWPTASHMRRTWRVRPFVQRDATAAPGRRAARRPRRRAAPRPAPSSGRRARCPAPGGRSRGRPARRGLGRGTRAPPRGSGA